MNEQHTPPEEITQESVAAVPETPQPAEPLTPEPENNDAERAAVAAKPITQAENDREVERQMRRMSRRSFLWGAAAVGTGLLGWRWLVTRPDAEGIPWPFRRALETNEGFARDYFRGGRLAPTFPRALAKEPRANGDIGLPEDFDPKTWQLRVTGLAQIPEDARMDEDAAEPTMLLSLADIQALPRVEMVTELKCIEGWSQIVHWAGARFADFLAKFPPETQSGNAPNVERAPDDLTEYVSLETPDGEYYVGLDMASALHPQTLLCYEMNGAPLTQEHGAPLRLVIPVKYGIKNIKRIGKIRFTQKRPADYWAEQGYDWYAGH